MSLFTFQVEMTDPMTATAKGQSRELHTWRRYPSYKPSGVEWLGDVPEHYQIIPIKRFVKIRYGLGEPPKELQTGLPIIRATNIDQGKIIDDGMMYVDPKDVPATRDAYLRENEIIIVRSGANTGDSTIIPKKYAGSVSGYDMVVTVKNGVPDYFAWQFLTQEVRDLQFGFYKLRAAQPHLNAEELGNTIFMIPSLAEQHTIAAVLDRETARIDALIVKKERQIELLQEKRAALISHAVTKGLDPSVPMKDSGVEWLGMVPEHWDIDQLRRVIIKFVDYRGKTPEKVDSGRLLITARNIKNGQIDFSLSEEFMKEEDYDAWMVRGFPEIGDVLITTEAPLGEVAQIDNLNIALAQRIILLKANKGKILNEFLKYQLISDFGKGELWSRATGSTAVGIKAEHLRSVLVIVPPLDEQKKIIRHIEKESRILENPVNKIMKSIVLLREYRSALISATVTGKIDVRQEAKA